jgi:VanZ family protein
MPGRVASLKDVAANSLGAVIGMVLAVAIEAMVRLARRRLGHA